MVGGGGGWAEARGGWVGVDGGVRVVGGGGVGVIGGGCGGGGGVPEGVGLVETEGLVGLLGGVWGERKWTYVAGDDDWKG